MSDSNNAISKYRGELMGIAILLVMYSHNSLEFPGIVHNINSGLIMLSQSGVDLFFLLSGFGCYYSMEKDSNPLAFYKKRLLRIVPAYVIVVFLFGIYSIFLRGASIASYLWTYSLISFFTDAVLHEWFIASIIVTYLVYPIIYYIVKKNTINVYLLLTIAYLYIALFGAGLIHMPHNMVIVSDIFITRVPAFLVGTMLAIDGNYAKKVKPILQKVIVMLGIAAAIVCLAAFKLKVSHSWTIIRVLFLVLVLAIVVLWTNIRNRINNHFIEVVAKFLCTIGAFTLEMYLIHEKSLSIIKYFLWWLPVNQYCFYFIINALSVVITILLARWLRVCIARNGDNSSVKRR